MDPDGRTGLAPRADGAPVASMEGMQQSGALAQQSQAPSSPTLAHGAFASPCSPWHWDTWHWDWHTPQSHLSRWGRGSRLCSGISPSVSGCPCGVLLQA